jgi:hypothetical protein
MGLNGDGFEITFLGGKGQRAKGKGQASEK